MKLGTESLVNHVLTTQSGAPVAVSGMGCTICYWSDRHAATVIGVYRRPDGALVAVAVQQDRAKRTDGHGMSDAQTYEYSRNHDAPVRWFKPRKSDGRLIEAELVRKSKEGYPVLKTLCGAWLALGQRAEFYDFSF